MSKLADAKKTQTVGECSGTEMRETSKWPPAMAATIPGRLSTCFIGLPIAAAIASTSCEGQCQTWMPREEITLTIHSWERVSIVARNEGWLRDEVTDAFLGPQEESPLELVLNSDFFFLIRAIDLPSTALNIHLGGAVSTIYPGAFFVGGRYETFMMPRVSLHADAGLHVSPSLLDQNPPVESRPNYRLDLKSGIGLFFTDPAGGEFTGGVSLKVFFDKKDGFPIVLGVSTAAFIQLAKTGCLPKESTVMLRVFLGADIWTEDRGFGRDFHIGFPNLAVGVGWLRCPRVDERMFLL